MVAGVHGRQTCFHPHCLSLCIVSKKLFIDNSFNKSNFLLLHKSLTGDFYLISLGVFLLVDILVAPSITLFSDKL